MLVSGFSLEPDPSVPVSELCPQSAEVRARVAAELGRDPFERGDTGLRGVYKKISESTKETQALRDETEKKEIQKTQNTSGASPALGYAKNATYEASIMLARRGFLTEHHFTGSTCEELASAVVFSVVLAFEDELKTQSSFEEKKDPSSTLPPRAAVLRLHFQTLPGLLPNGAPSAQAILELPSFSSVKRSFFLRRLSPVFAMRASFPQSYAKGPDSSGLLSAQFGAKYTFFYLDKLSGAALLLADSGIMHTFSSVGERSSLYLGTFSGIHFTYTIGKNVEFSSIFGYQLNFTSHELTGHFENFSSARGAFSFGTGFGWRFL